MDPWRNRNDDGTSEKPRTAKLSDSPGKRKGKNLCSILLKLTGKKNRMVIADGLRNRVRVELLRPAGSFSSTIGIASRD